MIRDFTYSKDCHTSFAMTRWVTAVALCILLLWKVSLTSESGHASFRTPCAEVTLAEVDASTYRMTIDCPEEPLRFMEQGNDRRVWLEYEHEGVTTDEGKASLPLITRFVAIPHGMQLHAEVVHRETRTHHGVRMVPVVANGDDALTGEWIDDSEWLQDSSCYPGESVTIGEGMRFHNLWLVPVTVAPAKYYPKDLRLEIDHHIELQLSLEGGVFRDPSVSQRPLLESFHHLYRSLVANYDLLQLDQRPIRGTYLIICPNSQQVIDQLQPLVHWKNRKGYPVVLATTAETGSSSSSILNYIRNAYQTWERPPEFVCLVGDADGSIAIPSGGGQYDHYYSMMDYDILADVLVGRLSVSDIATLQNVVNKIMRYEKEPYLGTTDWYRRGMVVAGSSISGTSTIHTKRSIRWRMMQHGYAQVDTMWYNMGGSIVTAIANGINQGITMFNYRGYLGMSGWSNSNTNNLHNGYMLPMVVTLTCGTGTFTSGTSLTEGFLRAGSVSTPKGAIAAIGTATYGTHTRYNNCMDVGTFAGFFDEGYAHAGEALVRGKMELARNYPNNGTATSHIYWNNLMGDPGLVVWKQVPIALVVEYPDTIALGTNVFPVTVVDQNDFPVEDAYVCLWQEDETLYQLGYTDQNGSVEMHCGDAVLGDFLVTITKPGHIPHLGESTVVTMAQSLGLSSAGIDDDNNGSSQGNGNGSWNPGERVEIRPVLWNRGTQQIQNLQATLTSQDPLLTVVQDSGSFGTVQAGDSVEMTAAFVVDMDSATPEDYLGRLYMDVQGLDFSQTIILEYSAESYQLTVNSLTIDDGNNGLLEPGETSNILISLANRGSFEGNSITAVLRADTSFCQVIDSTAVFGTIAPGSVGENTDDDIIIQANSHVIHGTMVDVTLITTSSEGIIDSVYAGIRVQNSMPQGQPLGPDEYGYFCFDNTDTQYPQAPIYTWIDIDPNFGGQGIEIPLHDYSNEQDESRLVMLPFTFQFYGRAYNEITVCSNGWLAMGNQTYFVNFRNWAIPASLGPPAMIAPFWDDLIMLSGAGTGKVYYWWDETNHLFIVQWSRVRNRGSYNPTETFQVILYDPLYYPTPSGDGDIVFQYYEIANVSGSGADNDYATTGIEDYDQVVGIEYTFNNLYPPEAAALSDGRAIRFTTAPGLAPEPPVISIHPQEFHFNLLQGQEATDSLIIGNLGVSTLYFSIQVLEADGRPLVSFPELATWPYFNLPRPTATVRDPDNIKGSRGRSGPPIVDGSGGPDAYGYTWIDSDEPGGPEYDWVDITSAGTAIQWQQNPDEESYGPVDVGFNFPFYGTLYNTIRICSNGYMSFTDDTAQYANKSLPNFDAPANLVAMWWDDLDPSHGGHFYYWSNQIDTFIVTVDSVQGWGQPEPRGGPYTFQAILTQSGKIKYQYREMGTQRLNEETIGIQDATRTIGLTVAYNTLYVHDEMAVEFHAPLAWLSVDPSQGSVLAGDSTTCQVTAATLLLEPGEYSGILRILSNDIQNPTIDVDVDLTVLPSGYQPPSVLDIPNQTINEGETFQPIELDNYVNDPVYSPEQIVWTAFGAQELTVNIVDRVATILIPHQDWFGEETITFRATNPVNLWDSDQATFTVLSVNDPPVIDPPLPDVSFRNDSLATLELDDYGEDVEDPDSLLTWSFSGNSSVIISIDNNHVATFTSQPGFVGEEEVVFTLEDTEQATVSDTVLVTVMPSYGVAGEGEPAIPTDYFLGQNYPNPFNPATTVRFGLPEPCLVRLTVYNILGQVVATLFEGRLNAGYHSVVIAADKLSSGLYFYSLSTPEFYAMRKMVLLR